MEHKSKIKTPDDLVVSSDTIALVRTKMATDRTLLDYVRTSVALAASAAGLLKFWDWPFAHFVVWPLMLSSVVALVIGVREYLKANRVYKILRTLEIEAMEKLIK